jgi:hypothetical protein
MTFEKGGGNEKEMKRECHGKARKRLVAMQVGEYGCKRWCLNFFL